MANDMQVLSNHQHPDFLEHSELLELILEYFSRKWKLKANNLESLEYVRPENA